MLELFLFIIILTISILSFIIQGIHLRKVLRSHDIELTYLLYEIENNTKFTRLK